MRSSPQESLYYVEVTFKGRVINNLTGVEKENYTFKFSAAQTPVVYQISPPSGIPGNLIEIYGKTIAGRYENLDFNVDYIDGSVIDKGAWLISAKQELFLYQTHSGNRGLLFEVWDDASDLTEAGPGYRWQFVPNAQSPMLTVSGTGWFSVSWNNAPRRMLHTNSTAHQVQTAIEELLSVGCDIEPASARILFHDGFEKGGTANSVTTEHTVYGTDPFCGRFSAHSPSQIVKISPSALQRYELTEYTHVCFAHKGHMSNVLHISVSYTNLSLCSVERNLTCQWDFDGTDPVRGAVLCEGSDEDGHLYVSTEDVKVSVTIQTLQVSSPPLGGTFRVHLGNTVIPDVSVHTSSHQLRKLLQANVDSSTATNFNTSDFIVTKDSESCYESVWTLTWRTKTGDLPNVINVSAENLTGLKPTVSSRVVYDGGVFIGPIFGDMLATSNNKTQVVLVVNDIPANCSGSCSFQFSQEMTPSVSDVEYSADNESQATVVIRGAGFSEEKTALQVQVKNTTCFIVMSNQTTVVCKTERLPLGVHQLTLLVNPYGFALNASTGEGIFLRAEPRLVAIEPPRASEIGGMRVALKGTGLDGVNLVLFGSQPCPVLEDTRSSTQIECKVPSRGAEDTAVCVTLISGYLSTTVTNLFQYDPSLNPAIVALSRNRSGLAGGQELQIGISSFAHYQESDIKVQIGGTRAQIQAQMDSGVNVTLPALAAGWYNVSVIISGVALASNRVEPLIHYISKIFSVEPCCGSFLGGTLLTISGVGFSQNRSLVSVSINEQTCLVTHLTEETIWCLTPPAANLSNEFSQDVPIRVNILLSNSSLQNVPAAKSITFNYQKALTPLVTAVDLEIVDSSLLLRIQGVNITGSVAKLGVSECELELLHDNETAMCYECSLPLSSLEPGLYPVRVIQRQLGYSRVTAKLQTITVTPQITSIFPSQGSVCGGTLLTISGIALKSRRDLVQVSLDGNYSCKLQSSDNSSIKCMVLPGTNLLPYQWQAEESWALNVTVTVNGISSVCLGDCMLHLHEQLTPLVDVVTWETNGTYTDVTIEGQRLAWPDDSPVVHVNDQAVCKVTFWNETNIRCRMGCVAPGEHNISISNRRGGQACFRNTSSVLTTMPQVLQFYPKDFSTNGGGLLTFAGAALEGKSSTSVLIGQRPCLVLSVTCAAIQCTVPPGNGTTVVRLTVDGISYDIGKISYNEKSTPTFLSLVGTALLLTINVSQVMEMDTIHVFVGGSACRDVTVTHSELQCSPPLLPAGEYPVLGLDVPRGWASSNLTFTSQLVVTAVHCNWGGLNGGVVHLRGTGFSPGQTLVTICGSPCEMLGNATTMSLSCLAPRLQEDRSTIIECDVQVTVGSYHQKGPKPYLYLCGESHAQQHQGDAGPSQKHFAGLIARITLGLQWEI
ncbi:UNVERIFIED_CONTAM: hypothetical protein H355_010107 [Colinus virginianus]|nr:hypothetical protein H355_010107 [Colinus virginianus]